MGNNKRKIKKMRTEKMKPLSKICHFCESDEDDEHRYGEFFHNDELSCHFFCLLFASGLSQNGDDEEGFYGFMFDDIQTELSRGTKLYCSYCKKKGATIGCCVTKCKKVFHFRCGCQNGSLNQYFGSFRSFCKDHKPRQDANEITKPKRFCHICYNRFLSDDDSLFSSCCNGDWFHRMCLQVYALTAGAHHFKCPLCNNKDDFSNEMEVFGLYLPVKDAAWELEENAYQELYPRNECTAQPCHCPKGKKYRKNDTLWSLINCSYCGSHEAHKGCHHIMVSTEVWICDDCKEIDSRMTKQTSSGETPQFADPGPSCPYAMNNIETTPSSSFHSEVNLDDDEKLKLKPIVVLEKLTVASPASTTQKDTQSTPAENCCGHGMCLMHFFTSNENISDLDHFAGKLKDLTLTILETEESTKWLVDRLKIYVTNVQEYRKALRDIFNFARKCKNNAHAGALMCFHLICAVENVIQDVEIELTCELFQLLDETANQFKYSPQTFSMEIVFTCEVFVHLRRNDGSCYLSVARKVISYFYILLELGSMDELIEVREQLYKCCIDLKKCNPQGIDMILETIKNKIIEIRPTENENSSEIVERKEAMLMEMMELILGDGIMPESATAFFAEYSDPVVISCN